MKLNLALLFTLGLAFIGFSETINLKITYKGDGISEHTVSAFIGGSFLGSGVTDNNGEVSIKVSSLPTKYIDLKGEKTCNNAKKTWDISGYVSLDGSNYYHLKMEEPLGEMAEASGGFISVNTLAASYGLVCSGSSSSNSNESTNSNEEGSTLSIPVMSREDKLSSDKTVLENKIESIDRKIVKKNEKIIADELRGSKKNDVLYDIKELEIDKKFTQNELDKVNLTIANGRLRKAERNMFKEREEELEDELSAIKSDRKKGKSLLSEEEKDDDLVLNEGDISDMSNMDLKRKKINLKSTLSKKKLKLKTKKRFMSPNEISEIQAQIALVEASILMIEEELVNRKGDEEVEEVEE